MLDIRKIVERIQGRTGYNQKEVAEKIFNKSKGSFNNQIRSNKIDWPKLTEWAMHENLDLHWLVWGKRHRDNGEDAIDKQLLESIIKIIETTMAEEGLALSPEDKAEAIAILYELNHGSEKEIEEGTVKRYLKLIA